MTRNPDSASAFRRIALGMSGGVDSSAAAVLLKRQGYEVCGFTLLLCPDASPDDQNVRDAKAVCHLLGMEHRVIDLRQRFADTVISDFVNEYTHGRTPNPCIVCNREIKFGAMLDEALKLGFDAVATGHYARIVTDSHGSPRIAKDPSPKDQSYVLWQLTPEQLSHVILPVSGYTKDELRQIVRKAGLPIFSKADSQDICFIPDGDYIAFLDRYAGVRPIPGNFIDRSGNVIGRHKGTVCYTIGQRKGLGGGFPEPMYVVSLNTERNEITLGGEGSQYASRVVCEQVNLHGNIDTIHFYAEIKHRYAARPASASVILMTPAQADNHSLTAEITFDQPQRALTPGQSAVFYDGDMLIGGGIISKVIE